MRYPYRLHYVLTGWVRATRLFTHGYAHPPPLRFFRSLRYYITPFCPVAFRFVPFYTRTFGWFAYGYIADYPFTDCRVCLRVLHGSAGCTTPRLITCRSTPRTLRTYVAGLRTPSVTFGYAYTVPRSGFARLRTFCRVTFAPAVYTTRSRLHVAVAVVTAVPDFTCWLPFLPFPFLCCGLRLCLYS